MVAPSSICFGRELTYKQWGVVKRFERLMTELADSGDSGPSNMAKVESLAVLLERLQKATKNVMTNYEHRSTAQGAPLRRPQTATNAAILARWGENASRPPAACEVRGTFATVLS